MHRIDHASANATLPAPDAPGTPGFFRKGDPQGGQEATVVTADWANAVQEELAAIPEGAGVALDKAKSDQLILAIASFRRAPLLNGKPVFSVNAGALTGAIKHLDGDDPSPTKPVYVLLRSANAASADQTPYKITAPLSLTLTDGSKCGHNDGLLQYLYWYLIANGSTIELSVSGKYFGEQAIVSTTAEGGAGGADSGLVMYAANTRTNVPCAVICYTEDTQTVAGTWGNEPSAVHPAPFEPPVISFSAHKNGVNQSGVPDDVWTPVETPTLIYNNGSLFASNKFTPPPGTVSLTGGVEFLATLVVGQYVGAGIFKNNTLFKRMVIRTGGTGESGAPVNIQDQCNGTDYYEFHALQNSGGAKIISGSQWTTYFMGSWGARRD